MEITGTIKQILDLQTGEGKNGPWKKQDFILETKTEYPKNVCITVWGDKIDQFQLAEGETVTVSINIESREYNGRWYTDVKAWKMDKTGEGSSMGNSSSNSVPVGEMPPDIASEEDDNDLPF